MYEYKVIEAPAPVAKGWFGRKKSSYANSLCDAINELALENWEYQHAEQGMSKSGDLLIFRRRIAKADEHMDKPKSFSDRMNEAEERGESGQSYDGPIRPRRARLIMNDAGTLTERPKTLQHRIADDAGQTIEGEARRVTPMKPNMAAHAAAV